MSGNGRKKPPLVAERRYGKSGGSNSAKPRAQATKRKASPKKKRAPKATERGLLGRVFFGLFGWLFRLIWRLSVRMGLIVAALIALAVVYFATTLPPVGDLLDARVRGSVTMLDRDGAVFAWRGEQFGGQITADTASRHLRNAVIATEDKRFYRHFGVSPRGIASAVRSNLREGRGPLSGHGGSTITQQTAKLLCLGGPYDPTTGMSEAEYEADCREGSI